MLTISLNIRHPVSPYRKRRLQILESQQRRLAAAGDKLQEETSLLVIEILLQDLPEPVDDPMTVVEAAVVGSVPPEISEVHRRVVTGY